MRAFLLVTSCALALALAGCASQRKAAPTAAPPPAAPPPSAPPAASAGQVPGTRGPVTAPWDTAGTASGKAARRVHVYPEGPNALGQKLVDALPDPSRVAPGVTAEEKGTVPVPRPPSNDPVPPHSTTCWEVQILTTSDKGRADQARDRAEKDLDLAAWVKGDGGIYRVRVGGCLTPDGAALLARRLHDEGYPEAFRVLREP
jgi:hypothetical protein